MSFFNEKVALVTGGASGIGLSIVQSLLENGIKGVTAVDISDKDWMVVEKDLNTRYPNKVLFAVADVTKQLELEGAFEKTIHTFKNLDIVVNNAGIANEVQWERTVAINLEAVIRGSYLAKDKYFPNYKSGEEGIIVNTASILGLLAIETLPVYCTAKHGVVGLGKALGMQKNNTRVITICPGLVSTPLHKKVVLFEKDSSNWLESVNCKRLTSPGFVAESVMRLMREGKHGSVWVIENEEPAYEVKFPKLNK